MTTTDHAARLWHPWLRWRRRMRRLLPVAALLLVMLGYAISFEAQNLIGEWTGEWNASTYRDTMSITINKVDGNLVEGTMYIRGQQKYHNRDLPFVATLTGTTLTASTPTMPGEPSIEWSMQVDDAVNTMTGVGTGTRRADVKLTKKK